MIHASTTENKRNQSRKVLEEVPCRPPGAIWGNQGGLQRETQDPGHMPLVGFVGGVLWVPNSIQAKRAGLWKATWESY